MTEEIFARGDIVQKKRTFVIIFSLFVLGFAYYATAKKEIMMIEAKTIGFDSFEELDAASPIIVIGKKIEEVDTEMYRSKLNGKVFAGHTKSEFLIQKILKNEYNPKIVESKTIQILESSVFNPEDNKIYSINGYENMKNGDKYLLFLDNEENGLFVTRGITFGKVPLSKTALERYRDKNRSSIENTHEEIFKQAREKYAE